METRFRAPKGALRSNLGLLAGTVIRELRMHPFWDNELEGVHWNFRPEWLEFTVLSIVTGGYLCRYSGTEDTFVWPSWRKQPNYGFMKDGSTPVSYYVKEMPLPPPYKSKPGFSPYERRCMEIDAAAMLIRDPDAFAEAAAEEKMSNWEAGTCLEWPSAEFLDGGGCPFYRGKYLKKGRANVLCDVVSPQLHGYVGIKFCEEGRKVYCPIWRAKGVMQNVSRLDTISDSSGEEAERRRPASSG